MKKVLFIFAAAVLFATVAGVAHSLTKSAEVIPPGSSPATSAVTADTSTDATIYPQEVIPPGS